jgi:hypothetical protein
MLVAIAIVIVANVFAAQEAHHHARRFEGSAYLGQSVVALAIHRAAVVIGLA